MIGSTEESKSACPLQTKETIRRYKGLLMVAQETCQHGDVKYVGDKAGNPKWLVHNIVPPSNKASIWPINMKWLLENFPPAK